ncbi:MAG: gliding motility protein GldA [Segetibacter sp.]|nr:gliding motility protein GldA [Segetibacter sp.]
MSIIVSELLKVYGEQKAVDHISFSVNKGEIVGFLGPNGAGKSTTMKMITGYLSPDGGTATVSGIDVTKNPIAAKKKIGYLPEANPLYFEMYIKEFLAFIAGVHGITCKKKRINQVIELTGLTLESRKKIGQLSKGYKQRVGLAAALIHDPEILILDEPTSGLDPNQIIEIRNVIKEQGKNKTILFSSHILQEVQAICDRVIIINQGKLVADDKLENLMQKQQGQQLVVLRLKEQVTAEAFAGVSTVSSIIEIPAATEGAYQWRFETSEPGEVKRTLLNIAVEKNLNIVSLQTESSSLEDIFKELTTVPS